jgi:hypothetical protein
MPLDKTTQVSLGLNHGLPTWYKRAHPGRLHPEFQAVGPSLAQPRTSEQQEVMDQCLHVVFRRYTGSGEIL